MVICEYCKCNVNKTFIFHLNDFNVSIFIFFFDLLFTFNVYYVNILTIGSDYYYFRIYFTLVACVIFFTIVSRVVEFWGGIRAGRRIYRQITRNMFVRFPLSFFDGTTSGNMMVRVTGDMDAVDGAMAEVFSWFPFFICLFFYL